ncbi:hypothetical protein GCM10010140_75570 [Streptosporangium pseudovulgare]|uniref:Uncharacterized protein n=1 Tax=Streptosporangium pseudovulgare TaxID=35765 RepID=A0ABQ2RMQ2_9ACTN|nr:hypothetical protein GCM10010140_75570 [Streptosporangium pseudovulgare]
MASSLTITATRSWLTNSFSFSGKKRGTAPFPVLGLPPLLAVLAAGHVFSTDRGRRTRALRVLRLLLRR